MSKKMNRNINLTEGSIPKGIIAFAIPLLLTNFLQQLYNTADLMIVGRFCLLYTSPSPRDGLLSRMPSSA